MSALDFLSQEAIVNIWESMPGQPNGFCKEFGYMQFARAVIRADRDIAVRKETAAGLMLEALLACRELMTKDLAGLQVLEPELKLVNKAISRAIGGEL